MTLLPPASWQPDPHDPMQLRWWDGAQWTSAVAPVPAPPGDAPLAGALEPQTAAAPKKRGRAWRITGIVVGALVVGGILARISPIAILLTALIVAGIALFVMISRPLPALGLRSRTSGGAALGVAALLVLGGGMASANSTPVSPTASVAQPLASAPSASATPTPTPTPKTTVVTETVETPIAFERSTVDDPQLDQGVSAIAIVGVNGVLVTTHSLTMVDGVEVAREVVSEVVQTAPVHEVTAIGSKAPYVAPPAPAAPAPLVQQNNGGCDPNYSGACVPIASDVDCAGGSGNGPAYVQGPVTVVGSDVYDLDRDGDGVACD